LARFRLGSEIREVGRERKEGNVDYVEMRRNPGNMCGKDAEGGGKEKEDDKRQ